MMNDIKIEWVDKDCILNSLIPQKKKKDLGLRIYQTKKTYKLDQIADKIIAIAGLTMSNTKLANVLIGFLLLLSVSPYDLKIMEGKGIDSIIDKLKYDKDKGMMYILKSELEMELNKLSLGLKSIDWFLENNIFEVSNDMFIFRGNRIKSAKIYQNF